MKDYYRLGTTDAKQNVEMCLTILHGRGGKVFQEHFPAVSQD